LALTAAWKTQLCYESARTIEYTRMILRQAFKQAIQWRLLTFNPCEAWGGECVAGALGKEW